MSQTPAERNRDSRAREAALETMSNYTDTASEADSISDEERVRRLFVVCDADGDGFIDSHDLIAALRDLGLNGVVDVGDLMHQMGAGTDGKVSYDQFLQCRLTHKSEIEALRGRRRESERPQSDLHWVNSKEVGGGLYDTGCLLATSSEHSLGAASGRQESWEFDSGARDLSPEPNTLQKLIQAAGGSLTGNTSNLLELANKLHLAALSSLKGEVSELHSRLQRAGQDRDTLEQALAQTQLERLRLVQENEERLERQSTQYEERLTELHSVIAELTRKLNRQQYNVIKEEGEDCEECEDEDDNEDGDDYKMSVATAADELKDCIHRPCHSEQVAYSLLERRQDADDGADACSSCSSDLSFGGSSSDDAADIKANDARVGEDDLDAKAVQAGENLAFIAKNTEQASDARREPLYALECENNELKNQLRNLNLELSHCRGTVDALQNERQMLRKQLVSQLPVQQARPLPLSAAASMAGISGFCSPINRVSSPVVVEEGPVCKVAERVRIKRLDARDKLLTGSEIANLGIRDPRIAEQLISSLQQDSSQEEARDSFAAACKVRELELEVERLASKAEHLRAQNDVLSLTLYESRAVGERLAVLLGKYESNCMALRLALEKADKVSEAFEVLAALVESEMALLLANCQVAGMGITGGSRSGWEEGSKDWSVLWKRATERRRSAENLARSLLARYDREKETWDDSGRHTYTTSSTSSGAESGSGSGSNPAATLEPTERKVRDVISRLKAERTKLESTVQQVSLPLESALVDPLPKEVLPQAEARKMDLEMVVIMQELMAMREERARLRTQVYLMEKERMSNEAQQQSYLAHIRLLQNQLGSADSAEGMEGLESGECTAREKKYQLRIQELTATIERVTQGSELRSQQAAELVNDVKKANATLVQLLERAKKKYQTRLKRLEQHLVNMSERHAMQVRIMKQRIIALEDETSARTQPLSSAPSETSL